MMLRGSNSPRFAGHDMSTQRKNIFEIFVACHGYIRFIGLCLQ